MNWCYKSAQPIRLLTAINKLGGYFVQEVIKRKCFPLKQIKQKHLRKKKNEKKLVRPLEVIRRSVSDVQHRPNEVAGEDHSEHETGEL